MNADDLLSINYDDFVSVMLNEATQSDLDNMGVPSTFDAPSAFDIPVVEFLMTQKEGGKIADRDAVIEFLENQIKLAAESLADVINS